MPYNGGDHARKVRVVNTQTLQPRAAAASALLTTLPTPPPTFSARGITTPSPPSIIIDYHRFPSLFVNSHHWRTSPDPSRCAITSAQLTTRRGRLIARCLAAPRADATATWKTARGSSSHTAAIVSLLKPRRHRE